MTMTEAEWLESRDHPFPMMKFLHGRASDRKLGLFMVGYCRSMWNRIKDQRTRNAAEFNELYVDGLATRREISAAVKDAGLVVDSAREVAFRTNDEADCQANIAAESGYRAALAFNHDDSESVEFDGAHGTFAHALMLASDIDALDAVRSELLCEIIRDIFGNPFRPLPPRPEAIAPLADQIYAGAWDQMPLLGEWLQEHGYWSEGEHCLDPNIHHVKGCWVVDWVTGRE
jgi:hypothetical protein